MNIVSISHGCILGWVSPSIPLLRSEASPLDTGPITTEEASWVGSCISVGGVIGNLFFMLLANKIGRKKTMLCLALPQIAFWLLIFFGKQVYMLYLARICSGIAGGGIFVTITLFIADVAEDR